MERYGSNSITVNFFKTELTGSSFKFKLSVYVFTLLLCMPWNFGDNYLQVFANDRASVTSTFTFEYWKQYDFKI